MADRNCSVIEVSARYGISTKSMNAWLNTVRGADRTIGELNELRKENAHLKSELQRILALGRKLVCSADGNSSGKQYSNWIKFENQ